jgi:ribosome biogenesis GTPase A
MEKKPKIVIIDYPPYITRNIDDDKFELMLLGLRRRNKVKEILLILNKYDGYK